LFLEVLKACNFLLFNRCLMSSSPFAPSWPSLPVQRWGSLSPSWQPAPLPVVLPSTEKAPPSLACAGDYQNSSLTAPSAVLGLATEGTASHRQGLQVWSPLRLALAGGSQGESRSGQGIPESRVGLLGGSPAPGTCPRRGAAGAEPAGSSRPELGGGKAP